MRGCFSDEDQRYILDIYEKEMKRINKTVEDIGRTTYASPKISCFAVVILLPAPYS